MIDANEIFFDSDKRVAFWCESVLDTNDLAMMCEYIVNNGVKLVSVPPKAVSDVWAFLEKQNVKILTRYPVNMAIKNIDDELYELGANITSVCKSGASGVQIFVKMADFEKFIDVLQSVRDDLFFGHELSIVMDISDIDMQNLGLVFQKLREIRADSFGLTLNEDAGNRSDFVGRVYCLLQNFDFDGQLHFMLGNNFDRMDQAIRLTECLRPEIGDKLRFFLDY